MKFLKTPGDSLLALALIQRVSHVPDRGVMLLDGYGRILEFIRVEDDVLALRVRGLINKAVLDGKRAAQPDWSFLTMPAVVAE